MKMLTILAAGLAGGLALAPTAHAAQWQSINQRQARLDQRINRGVRNGSLTWAEAVRLRNRFWRIARLETRYRRTGGLSYWERQDLDRRFDALSRSIRVQRHDRQYRRRGR